MASNHTSSLSSSSSCALSPSLALALPVAVKVPLTVPCKDRLGLDARDDTDGAGLSVTTRSYLPPPPAPAPATPSARGDNTLLGNGEYGGGPWDTLSPNVAGSETSVATSLASPGLAERSDGAPTPAPP